MIEFPYLMEEHYQTIARQLLAEINAGHFKEGDTLPTRTALALRFKVARATLDRAVSLLVRKGVLDSSRGAGTFVASQGRLYHFALVSPAFQPVSYANLDTRFKLDLIPCDSMLQKASRKGLLRFDGVLWQFPEDLQLSWARELDGRVPQLLVNRDVPEFNYISTDHRGAVRELCARRLAEMPSALPVFLGRKEAESLVWGMREEGFVDACRQAERFYEMLPLTCGFEESIAILDKHFETPLKRPLLLLSGSLENTGAAMAWIRDRNLQFGRDVLYSDFDNGYPGNVWGVKVTTFLQDFNLLLSEAAESLAALVDGKTQEVQRLIMPKLLLGGT